MALLLTLTQAKKHIAVTLRSGYLAGDGTEGLVELASVFEPVLPHRHREGLIGAIPGEILMLVLREILIMVGVGVGLGLPSIWVIKRIIAAQLFGISVLDPLAILGSIFVLAGIAVLAGYLPARWASQVDPVRALHYDG